MARPAETCAVALLGRDDVAREQLRRALQELGATVVFESEPAAATDDGLLETRPNVLIVNLEEGGEDDLDHLQLVLDDPGINVVFNEAGVSRALEGWDLARWARHLASKVLGHDHTMPPVPAGASRLAVAGDAATPKADAAPDLVGWSELPAEVDSEPPGSLDSAVPGESASDPDPSAVDIASLEAALGLAAADAAMDQGVEAGADPAALLQAAAEDDVAFDLASLDLLDTTTQEGPAGTEAVAADGLGADSPDDLSVDAALDLLAAQLDETIGGDEGSALASASDGTERAQDAEDWLSLEGLDFTVPSGAQETEPEDTGATLSWSLDEVDDLADAGVGLDPDVAALAAQLEVAEGAAAGEGAAPDEDAGIDAFLAEAVQELGSGEPDTAAAADEVGESAAAADGAVAPEPAAAGLDLSLAPLDDGGAAAAEPDEAGPEPGADSKPIFDFSKLDHLSLAPLDGEVEDAASTADPLMAAMGLVDAPETAASADQVIANVVVLAASIGGPDALRSFLSELKPGLPVVFLIVQHLESGYFERLAQQLQKATQWPVQLVADGMNTAPGNVLVVPAGHRVILERSGQVSFKPEMSAPVYTPSIDNVLHDVADRFGRDAMAIIFSGMAGDAVEGAAYLTTKGGEVWAQDPESCVISTMVDGARARGLVEFTGSPRELAARCGVRYANQENAK